MRSSISLHKKWLILISSIIALLLIVSIITTYTNVSFKGEKASKTQQETSSIKLKALIADGLYEDYPNMSLIEELKNILKAHGYSVSTVLGRNVTLDVFRNLTSYNIVILRLHGGASEVPTVIGKNVTFIGLFTGVPWDPIKYSDLKRRLLVTKGRPFLNPNKLYVAALPRFFLEEVEGRFPTYSIVIAASCYSLRTVDIAYAMFQKGLMYYIGWGAPVTVEHMDKSLELLLKLVFEEGLTWVEAVEKVNQILGPDPTTSARIHIAIPKAS